MVIIRDGNLKISITSDKIILDKILEMGRMKMPSVSSIILNVNSRKGLTETHQGGALGGSPTNLDGFSYFGGGLT